MFRTLLLETLCQHHIPIHTTPERWSKIASPPGLCFKIGDSKATPWILFFNISCQSDARHGGEEWWWVSSNLHIQNTIIHLSTTWLSRECLGVSTVFKVSLHANTRAQQVHSWCQSNARHIDKEYLWWHLWNTRVYRNCAQQLANDKSFATNRFPLDYGTSLQIEGQI